MRRVFALAVGMMVFLVAFPLAQSRPAAPSIDGLMWRHIGPASFGGRIDDIEAVPDQPWIIFVGAASGGIFKSVNNGISWKPVFDRDATNLSVGDIAIAPSDPNIVWAGSGEANSRQSSSWGDGIYRSLDGGETWTHMGLRDTHHIGRIVIDPHNPNIVFAAALGHLWGPNDERGLYKTTDGGKAWRKVLSIDKDTGVVDIAMDADGRTMFAGAYQRRRRAWGFVGGGAGSGLYRSLDGGETWQRLQNGLPSGAIGRIGVAISRSHPDIAYAIIEHKTEGGVYRSDDRGNTWTKRSNVNPRPMYYSQIRIDPVTPDKVWILGTYVHLSVDGGKTFSTDGTGEKIHVDHHALWIDPRNPAHMMLGNDGGLYFTYDGTKNWQFVDNLPIGQYYDIGIDSRDPYYIYGGTQDNGTWALPVRTYSRLGITNLDVINIAYGDGFYTEPDHSDPSGRYIYANSQSGRTYFVDLNTREEKGIRPVPADAKEKYRFNWSTPLLVSPHDAKVVYYGGNKLFRSGNRGHSWTEISGDLTKNQEWKKLPLMGERNDDTLSRDDGVSDFNTITTIAESPVQAGVLYVGVDDGNVQVTRDGGKSWQNVTDRFKLAGPRWVTRVLASRHGAGTAYVTFDGHYDDDFAPYVFKTTDFGATWTSIRGDLPDGVVANTIAEHHRNPQVLFVGAETGLYFSTNGGRTWTLASGNLPRVPVDDILVSETTDDVILGTHGRSIIVLDDVSVLEHLTDAVVATDAHLFPIRPATQRYVGRLLPVPGASEFAGPNPPEGALITYYLKDDRPAPPKPTDAASTNGTNGSKPAAAAAPTVTIAVTDAQGRTVRELTGPDKKGIHRVSWDLREPLLFKPSDSDDGWFGEPLGVFALPGDYTVTLTARGKSLKQTLKVGADPRVQTTPDALRARHDLSQAANELMRAFSEASDALKGLDGEHERMKKIVDTRGKDNAAASKAVEDFGKKLKDLKEKFKTDWGGPRFSILDLLGQLQASTSAPTEAQARARDQLAGELTENIGLLNDVLSKDLPAAQSQLAGANLTALVPSTVVPPKR